MNKIFNRGLSFVLCLVLCFGMCTAAFAAGNPDVTLTLDKTTAKENELPATITMTVATTEALSIMGFAGKVTVPEGFTLQEIQSMDKNLSIANVRTQKFGWMVAAEENVQNWAKVVFSVPSNLSVGTYTLGLTEIFASRADNTNPLDGITEKTVTFTVTEKDPNPIAATGVKLNKNTLDLTVDSSETLTANVLPVDATNKDVTWVSSDTDVAAVDENGKVTAAKAGKATITVSVKSNPELTDTCEVTVTDQIFSVTGVMLTPDKAELYVGETKNLTVVFAPSNATNKNVTWESSDPAVATVADGVVTAVGKGTATITVTTEDGGFTATCEVTVKIPVSSVTLNPTSIALVVGNTKQLIATVEPANADDSTVTWKSSDTNVATVDQTGKVTAVGVGTTTITATAGGKSATCTVTVTAKPVPIKRIALSDAAVSVGRTIQLEPVFTPADTTQRDVIWTSSDRTIATVDANGRVRGVSEGKVTITVTSTADRNITASCTVTVTKNLSDAGLAAIIGALGNGSLPFNDVTVRDYFYDAVKWAVDRGITSGTSRYTFSPDAPCTRAQVVTFLWRAAGCPQSTSKSNPFTDVRADDYFYDAVLWAVENGITNGTSAKTFSPDATVTRAQVVTFLWRANGQPAAGNSGFLDVSSNAYYARAVDWAFANGITTGMDYGAFGPDTACTRAQIVTFLYRAR